MAHIHKFHAWIVNHRDDDDDEQAAELAKLKMYQSSKAEAWKDFLALCGKDRKHWNRLGYIATKVHITIEVE